MAMTMPNDPLGRDPKAFREQVESTFSQLGGRVVGVFDSGLTNRLYFDDVESYLDVSAGPGNKPIVGRGSGMYIFDQIAPNYTEKGIEGYRETSAWGVLGQVTQQALGAARTAYDAPHAFGTSIANQLGAQQMDDGEGIASVFLPRGYERSLPSAALRRFEATKYAEAVPMQAASLAYPGQIVTGQARGGFMPITSFEELSAATIGGIAQGGGKLKQTGVRPYDSVSFERTPWRDIATGSGLTHRAQIQNIILPLGGAIGATEGQATIQSGTMTQQRRTEVKPLSGWGAQELSQISSIKAGAIGRYGERISVLQDKEGKSLFDWRNEHWSFSQVANAHISLPQGYEKTNWYQSLDEKQREMFTLSGGAVQGGRAVPALVMDTIGRRGAGGATSGKGMGMKALYAEGDIASQIGGLTEEEARSVNILYEEGMKEPYTRMMAIGAGLGITKPGDQLFSGGQLNEPLARKILEGIGQHTKTLTRTYEVTPGLAEAYTSGAVPGITETAWLPNGNLQVTRSFQAYVGPSAEWTRAEYPMSQAKANPEEMRHMQLVQPELYSRVLKTGYSPEAHLGISRAFWASQGRIGLNQKYVTPYADVADSITALSQSTQGQEGALVQAMIGAGMGRNAIALPSGMYLPSPRDISRMSATDMAGNEVSAMVRSYERALASGSENAEAYEGIVAKAMVGERWMKETQSYGLVGVTGPGTSRANQDVGEFRMGEAQFRAFARRAYGYNPSKKELAEFRGVLETQDVIGKLTRFPQSDVYRQNETFLRMRYDPNLGENELSVHPFIPMEQRGDTDADLFRVFTTAFERMPGGRGLRRDRSGQIMVNNAGMGEVATEEGVLSNIIGMMRAAAPGTVQLAERDIEGQEFENEAMRLGALARRVPLYFNEYGKHISKEQTVATGGDPMTELNKLVSRLPDAKDVAGKQEGLYEAKGMMGRTYNALRRTIAERARETFGADSELTRSIFDAAANSYQPALDVGRYDVAQPFGLRSSELGGKLPDTPSISWGLSRMMEMFGTQSLLHGGGYMQNVTGAYKYGTGRRWGAEGKREDYIGWTAPWQPGSSKTAQGATAMFRTGLAQSAIYYGEATPGQVAAMLTEGSPEQTGAIEQAVTEARKWAAGMGTTSADDALATPQGIKHQAAILKAAGLTSNRAVWESTAPAVVGGREEMLFRTERQYQKAQSDPLYKDKIEQQMIGLRSSFQEMTGRSLGEEMERATARQGPIAAMSGRAVAPGDQSDIALAAAYADYLPQIAGETRPREEGPRSAMDLANRQIENDPIAEMSKRYAFDFGKAGATGVRVLGAEAYAEAAKAEGVPEGAVGFTRGRQITVEMPTPARAQEAGASQWELTRRRLVHEAGHTAFESDEGLAQEAMTNVSFGLRQGNIDETKMQQQYGTNWRRPAASEMVAQAYGQSAGQLPTYSSNVSRFDIRMSRRASALSQLGDMGGGEGAAAGGGGEGGGPGGPLAFLAAPPGGSPGGGGSGANLGQWARQMGMAPNELGQFLWGLSRASLGYEGKKTQLQSIEAQRLGFEVIGGNLQALEGEAFESLVQRKNYAEVQTLQDLQKWMTGKGGAPANRTRYALWELGKISSPAALGSMTAGEFTEGLSREDYDTAMQNVARQAHGPNPLASVKDLASAFAEAATRLEKHSEAVVKATENYENLDRVQQKAYRDVMRDVATVEKGKEQIGQLGPQGQAFLQQFTGGMAASDQVRAAALAQASEGQEGAYGRLASGASFGQQFGGAVSSIYRDLTRGYKMMQMARLWNMTGGQAMQAESVAMQQELAVQAGLASWSGGGQLGPVSSGLLGIQAQKTNAQSAMGRGAYMGYGAIQEDLAGMGGELAGVALPALGAGMVAQSLLGGLVGGPIGLAVGGAVGLVGGINYLSNLGADENERDYRMGGGFWQQTIGQLGDIVAGNGIRSVDEYQAQMRRGQALRSGDMGAFAGDTGAQAVVLRHWAGEQSNIMSTEQWARVAGQYQSAMGGITNLNDIPTDMLEQAALRGYQIPEMVSLARGLGGTTQSFQPLMQAMLAQPNNMGMTAALQQYAPAGQMGLVSPQWFAQNVGGLQEMTGWQANRFNQLMSGDRYLWTQYAQGNDLGLTGTAMSILDQIGPQDWMTTVEPATGLPLHTTTGALYGGEYGALSTQAAQQGGLRGIQWAYIQQQNEQSRINESRQWDRFQMGYAYRTGGTLGGYPGTVPSGLMNIINQTGGVWGLEDQQRQMGYDWQQYQFGYQQQSFDMSNWQWMENWNARYGRWNVESQWADQDMKDQTAKWARQDEHWMYNWQWQENMSDLQFGWQMEDLDEGIRYSTGRQKLQLMRQKERATITEGMRGDKADEAKEYWEDMKKFREQDIEKEKARRDQRNRWAEEDMQRSKRHHEERTDLQQSYMDAQREHYEATFQMQERRIQLDRRYWQEMQKAQADDMRRANEINVIQRRLREDQFRLNVDAQNAMARFNIAIREIGNGIDAITAKVRAFNSAVRAPNVGTTSTGTVEADRHNGGPVGLFQTTGTYGDVSMNLSQGEYVVPKDGALVQRDDRVVEQLTRIATLLEEGNGRFTVMLNQPERAISDVYGAVDAAYAS